VRVARNNGIGVRHQRDARHPSRVLRATAAVFARGPLAITMTFDALNPASVAKGRASRRR
jgi:hypothetical protein